MECEYAEYLGKSLQSKGLCPRKVCDSSKERAGSQGGPSLCHLDHERGGSICRAQQNTWVWVVGNIWEENH